MSPEEDVGAVAGRRVLLEPDLYLIRVGNRYFYSCILCVSLSDPGDPVVSLVAVNPDRQLVLRDGSAAEESPRETLNN